MGAILQTYLGKAVLILAILCPLAYCEAESSKARNLCEAKGLNQ